MSDTLSKVEAKTEEEKLADLASQALRGPRFGIYEQLVCQHLVQATVTGNPLRKIQLVCEAAYMVDAEKQKVLGLDMERLEVVKAVCDAFKHRTETRNKNYSCLVQIPFGFEETEKNYNRYIKPWRHTPGVTHYPLHLAIHYRHLGTTYRKFYCASCGNFLADDLQGKSPGIKDDSCVYCGADLEQNRLNPFPYRIQPGFKAHDSVPSWEMFFAFCQATSLEGYNDLKTSFLKWAMPFTMELMAKLTRVVRPEIYNEIARMFVRAKRETKTAP